MKEYINKLKSLVKLFMLQLKPKKPKEKGFSLIELLVVVGIMGVLAVIAIPAYNRYRATAAQGAFDATGTNIVRAFQACIATKAFVSCDTLSELAIDVAGNKKAGGMAPTFCADVEQEIGGESFRGCYQVNAATSGVTSTFNSRTCFTDIISGSATNDCDTDMDGSNDAKKSAGFQGGDCETAALPTTKCQSNTDCTGAGVGDVCSTTGSTGVCSNTAGTCS